MSVPLITIHVIISVILILIVLLQVGRGAEAGAMFGGSGQAYSLRGSSTFIGKFTTFLAIAFMLTSLLLTYHTSDNAKSSVIDNIPKEKTESAIPESTLPLDGDQIQEKTSPTASDPVIPIQDIPRDKTEETSESVPSALDSNTSAKDGETALPVNTNTK